MPFYLPSAHHYGTYNYLNGGDHDNKGDPDGGFLQRGDGVRQIHLGHEVLQVGLHHERGHDFLGHALPLNRPAGHHPGGHR